MNRIKEGWQIMPRWIKVITYIILGVIGAAIMGFVFGIIIERLWNWLMPGIFSLREITYWEAVGLFILARMIFGTFGNSGNNSKPSDKRKHRRDYCGKDSIKNEWKNWKYYDEWWENEGKKDFENYTGRKIISEVGAHESDDSKVNE